MNIDALVLGTRNLHKAAELRAMLADLGLQLSDLSEYPSCPDVLEDENTLVGNAIKKAREAHRCTGLPSMADDSGLEVEYLLGEPGVLSARYAGASVTYAENNRLLLRNLRGLPPRRRGARFRTVIAVAFVGKVETVEGICEGTIVRAPRGTNGFGYDPLFQPLGATRTYAEMSAEEKNALSHRAQAVEKLKSLLRGFITR